MPKLENSGILRTKPKSSGKWLGFGSDVLNMNGIMGDPITMFGHQQRVYENLSNERNVIIQHPGGSGKSTTVRFTHGRKVFENDKQKFCIIVPQTLISKSFLPPTDKNGKQIPLQLQYPDGTLIEWDLTNLCEKGNGKTKILKNWLLSDRKKIEGMEEAVIITTYHALVSVWKNLTSKQKKEAIKNTVFCMDEAHRILYQDVDENEYDANETNCIGDMIKFVVNQDYDNAYLWLTTATFIRGDNASILPPDIYDKFKKDYLPLDEHWAENIKNIETFSYDFIVYKATPDEEIEILLKNNVGKKTLFYCPGQGTKHGDKYEFRDRMINIIRKVWKDALILDLIDEEGRDVRKQQFISGEIKPDVVLSVDLFNEGVDWVQCEQIFDIVPSNSLTRHLQKNLRLWRDCPGKSHIAHYAFFQFNKKALDEEGYTRSWNEIFALWTASMILDEQLCPINIAALNGEPEKRNSNGGIAASNPFKVMFPDLNKQNEILGKVGRELIVATNASEEKLSSAEIRECIHRVMEDYLPEEEDDVVENVCRVISAMLNRKSQPDYGMSVSGIVDAGFEKVYRDDFDGIWRYAAECGIESMEELRKCYKNTNRNLESWYSDAKLLAKQNGWDGKLTNGISGHTEKDVEIYKSKYKNGEIEYGILPHKKWLEKNGYHGLYTTIYYNENVFKSFIKNNPTDELDNLWNEWFQLLKEYKECMGNTNLKATQTFKDKKLGEWCHIQRQKFRGNSWNKLSDERIDKLKSIGFDFFPLKSGWVWFYDKLKEYKKEFGDCEVPFKYKVEEKSLGGWCLKQRQLFWENKLEDEKVELLKELDFRFEKFDSWMKMFNILMEYKKEFGHTFVKAGEKYKEENLGTFIAHQRVFYKNKTLSQERIYLLDSIGFCWNPPIGGAARRNNATP